MGTDTSKGVVGDAFINLYGSIEKAVENGDAEQFIADKINDLAGLLNPEEPAPPDQPADGASADAGDGQPADEDAAASTLTQVTKLWENATDPAQKEALYQNMIALIQAQNAKGGDANTPKSEPDETLVVWIMENIMPTLGPMLESIGLGGEGKELGIAKMLASLFQDAVPGNIMALFNDSAGDPTTDVAQANTPAGPTNPAA